jgi:hypothetical protein
MRSSRNSCCRPLLRFVVDRDLECSQELLILAGQLDLPSGSLLLGGALCRGRVGSLGLLRGWQSGGILFGIVPLVESDGSFENQKDVVTGVPESDNASLIALPNSCIKCFSRSSKSWPLFLSPDVLSPSGLA